jgi:shikimate kinase
MNIVLVGYRGVGKSTVGKLLAERLGLRYVSMDAEIIKKMDMDISEIVLKYGWGTFRDLESELTKELTCQDGMVIDTGGGVIERRENIDQLRQNTLVFWLRASVVTVLSRIKDCSTRPALTAGKTFMEEVADVLALREPKYQSASHHVIDTDGSDPNAEVETIARIWESLPLETRTPNASGKRTKCAC